MSLKLVGKTNDSADCGKYDLVDFSGRNLKFQLAECNHCVAKILYTRPVTDDDLKSPQAQISIHLQGITPKTALVIEHHIVREWRRPYTYFLTDDALVRWNIKYVKRMVAEQNAKHARQAKFVDKFNA